MPAGKYAASATRLSCAGNVTDIVDTRDGEKFAGNFAPAALARFILALALSLPTIVIGLHFFFSSVYSLLIGLRVTR